MIRRFWVPVRCYLVKSNHINHTLMHTRTHTHTHSQADPWILATSAVLFGECCAEHFENEKWNVVCFPLTLGLFFFVCFSRGARSPSRSPLLPSFILCTSFSSHAMLYSRFSHSLLFCSNAIITYLMLCSHALLTLYPLYSCFTQVSLERANRSAHQPSVVARRLGFRPWLVLIY